jgi:hypothetical protein
VQEAGFAGQQPVDGGAGLLHVEAGPAGDVLQMRRVVVPLQLGDGPVHRGIVTGQVFHAHRHLPFWTSGRRPRHPSRHGFRHRTDSRVPYRAL